ncbi:hypothetical protein B0H19DRAFT_1182925 [Mycena capillaripes]|nr:hypothetical protein B0H19DRAFT_1182925 [Mycena capillaripes]
MVLFSLLLGVLLTVGLVASQVAPLSWNSTILISTEERVRLAGAALDLAIEKLNADGLFDDEGYGITGNLYSQMAEFDIATNQTKYQNVLEQYFQLQETKDANFSDPYVSHPFIQSQHLALIQITIDQLSRRIMGWRTDTLQSGHMQRTRTAYSSVCC